MENESKEIDEELKKLQDITAEKEKEQADLKKAQEQLQNLEDQLRKPLDFEALKQSEDPQIQELLTQIKAAEDQLKPEYTEKLTQDVKKLAETVTAERDGLKQQVDELQKQLEGAVPGDDVSALKQELEGAKASLATAETENASLKEQLNTVNGELEESRQAVEDLNAKVAAYEAGPGKGQGQGEAPKTNGMQPSNPHLEAGPVWDSTLSAVENYKRLEEYKKKLQSRISQ